MDHLQPQIIRRRYSDFDALAEAAESWDLGLNKLDCTPFYGEALEMISPDFILTRGYFNSRMKQEGKPPDGFRTFGVPMNPALQLLWNGRQVIGNSFLLALPDQSELQAISDPGFDIFTISVTERTFLKQAETMGFHDFGKRFQSLEALQCDPAGTSRLQDILLRTERNASHLFFDYTEAKERILIELVRLTGSKHSRQTPLIESSRQRRAIEQTDRYIHAHPDEPPTVKILCEVTGISKRTLEYAFGNYLGVSPKAYINAVRLNQVRKHLCAAKPGSILVSEAANIWGFWHMGQFAADYRKLFGEKPSDTLGQRCRVHQRQQPEL